MNNNFTSLIKMYDPEKGHMVYKDINEMNAWSNKTVEVCMKEYGQEGQIFFDKWKKDGERFLKEDFLKGAMFPYLNDGRPELLEWIEGSLQTRLFSYCWYYELRMNEGLDFLKQMHQVFSSHGKRLQCFAFSIQILMASLNTEKECNEMDYESIDKHEQYYSDEGECYDDQESKIEKCQ